jgi:predicted PurR-regulated permease PerM
MTARSCVGIACLFVAALVTAFLANANYNALGHHPGRIATAAVMVCVTLLLLLAGIRLLRRGTGDP